MSFIESQTLGRDLFSALDMVGTFVFALSGASAGARRGLDLFGALLLAFVTATAGGIMTDLLIGATPPHALTNMRPFLIAMAGGLAGFGLLRHIDRFKTSMVLLDAVGLSLFAVTGASHALAHGIAPLFAALLGMLTAIGGGLARDVLSGQVPVVLRDEIYASAALLGAGVVVMGQELSLPADLTAPIGAMMCCALRLAAVHQGWRLPAWRQLPSSKS
jgi:uncharacterized membrane protein YeiH